jgi:hypothetical protein
MQTILTISGILWGSCNLFFGLFLAAACVGQRFFNRQLEGEPGPSPATSQAEEEKLEPVPSPVTSQAEEKALATSIPSNALTLA